MTNLQGAGREGGTEICMSPSLLPGHARWKRAQTWIILEWFELLATKTGPSTSFIFSLTHICCLYIFSQPSRHAPASTCFVCTLCCFVCTLCWQKVVLVFIAGRSLGKKGNSVSGYLACRTCCAQLWLTEHGQGWTELYIYIYIYIYMHRIRSYIW